MPRPSARHCRSGAASRSRTSSTTPSSSRRPRGSGSCADWRSRSAIEAELELGGGPELIAELQALVAATAAAGAAARVAHARALPRGSPAGGARRVSRGQAAARRGARAGARDRAARARARDPPSGSELSDAGRVDGSGLRTIVAVPERATGLDALRAARRGARGRPAFRGSSCSRASSPPPSWPRRPRSSTTRGAISSREGARVRVAAFSSSSPARTSCVSLRSRMPTCCCCPPAGDPLDGPFGTVFEQATCDRRGARRGGRPARDGPDRRSVRRVRARLGRTRARRLGGDGARAPAALDRRRGRRAGQAATRAACSPTPR